MPGAVEAARRIPSDAERPPVQVDVVPAQPEELTLAKSHRDREDIGGPERLVDGGLDQPARLLAGQDRDAGLGASRSRHHRQGVRGQDAVPDGVAKGGAEGQAHMPNRGAAERTGWSGAVPSCLGHG
jgi:hypothetical protein